MQFLDEFCIAALFFFSTVTLNREMKRPRKSIRMMSVQSLNVCSLIVVRFELISFNSMKSIALICAHSEIPKYRWLVSRRLDPRLLIFALITNNNNNNYNGNLITGETASGKCVHEKIAAGNFFARFFFHLPTINRY